MGQLAKGKGWQSLMARPITAATAFEGSEGIAQARGAARRFLADVQAGQGLSVSGRVRAMVELVVSELVTNARKYAPGPCRLTLEVSEGTVKVTVWDSNPALPVARRADPGRIGRHGLEIVMAVCQAFEGRRESAGKRLTAAITLTDDPDGTTATSPM
ncbi:ATP-binding protein [Streptomyces arenae]|uniref:ATP-binding protein n=1 Tax=Streptomyces arenae TaxID=29301 RepID=UPI00265AD28D|nr:ATP-binding protein [Streptomyces arenae]MCG7204420.1 ATP-binding protein [Streptomyces arenae]